MNLIIIHDDNSERLYKNVTEITIQPKRNIILVEYENPPQHGEFEISTFWREGIPKMKFQL